MGISSDGQLSFGVPVGEEDEPPAFMEGFEDFEDFVLAEKGYPEWHQGMTDDESSNYWDGKRKILEAYPVRLEMYCSYDYPMYLLIPNVEQAHMTVRRGYLTSFHALPQISSSAIQAMKAWCDSHGVDCGDPQWHLSSMYG